MKRQREMLSWLVPFYKPYRYVLLLVLTLSLVSTVLELSYPFLTKIFIDDVLIEPKYSLKSILILAVILMTSGILLQIGNSLLYLRTTLKIIKSLRLHLFNHLERLSYQFFMRTRIGDITTRLNGDINIVQNMLTDGVLNFITAVLTFTIITCVLIYLHWQLYLITLFMFPILMISLYYFRPLITKIAKEIREKHSDIQAHMIETFSNIRLIKLLVAEKEQSERLDIEIESLNKKSIRYAIVESLASGIPRLVTFFMTIIILFVGGSMVLADELTVGSLLAFTTYLNRYFSPVQTVSGLYIRYHNMLVSLRRLTEYLDDKPEKYEADYLSDTFRKKTLIECKSLTYAYKKKQLFENVNLQLKEGTVYALHGPSGVGKSTFIDLLVNLKQPTNGDILYNKTNVKDIPVDQLRKSTFVVPQEIEVLHDTVRKNILFGMSPEEKQKITEEDILRVTRAIGLHDEIMSLPNQYDTVLGERGKVLSGGQKQRLSIARGLLRNPAVLILDEATSGLDYELEREIFTYLETWVHEERHRMLIIVSHRINSLDWVDAWLLFERGKIILKRKDQFMPVIQAEEG